MPSLCQNCINTVNCACAFARISDLGPFPRDAVWRHFTGQAFSPSSFLSLSLSLPQHYSLSICLQWSQINTTNNTAWDHSEPCRLLDSFRASPSRDFSPATSPPIATRSHYPSTKAKLHPHKLTSPTTPISRLLQSGQRMQHSQQVRLTLNGASCSQSHRICLAPSEISLNRNATSQPLRRSIG